MITWENVEEPKRERMMWCIHNNWYRNRNVWMLTTLPIPTHTCQLITTGKDIGVGTFNAKCYYSSTVSFSVLHSVCQRILSPKSSCHPIFSRFNEQTRMLTYPWILREGCAALSYNVTFSLLHLVIHVT